MDNTLLIWDETLGCYGLWEDERDYVLCDWEYDLLPKLYKQNEIRFEYNQANQDWSTVSCTIFAAMWMLSDLIDVERTYDQIKEVDELSYITTKYPTRIRGRGWRVRYAVWLVRDWYNASELSKQYGKINYYKINVNSDMIEKALDNLYTLDTNFCPTSDYTGDYRMDAVLDWKDFWTNTNWHSVDIIKKDWVRGVKDSYKGRKTKHWDKDCNFYELKHELKELSNYSQRCYIYTFVKEDNMEEIKRLNNIKSEANNTITALWKLRNAINDDELKEELHKTADKCRAKINQCNEMLKPLM